MILIDEILISDDLVEESFVCQLEKCKGACCWEGDFGAPLEDSEKRALPEIYPKIKHLLSEESRAIIEAEGPSNYYSEPKFTGTRLMDDGSCVFLNKTENGIARCAIEQAYQMGLIQQQKPISCHLYPVRISKNEQSGFEALNYDRWDICAPACQLGKELKMPLYVFVKEALIRKYGESFYKQLETTAQAYL